MIDTGQISGRKGTQRVTSQRDFNKWERDTNIIIKAFNRLDNINSLILPRDRHPAIQNMAVVHQTANLKLIIATF